MKRLFIILLFLSFFAIANAQETTYFLKDTANPIHSQYKLLDVVSPTSSYSSFVNLDEGAAIWATTPFDNEMKINGDVSITIFIEAFFIKPDILPVQVRVIKVSLLDIAPSGNIDVIDSSRPATIMFFGNETMKPYTFKLDNIEYVIPAGHSLGVKIEKAVDLLKYFPFSVLSPFTATNIYYDSIYTKSFVSVPFNISKGINLECFDNEKEIKPGEYALYTLLIYNYGDRNDTIKLSSSYAGDKWKVKISPSEVKVEANSWNFSEVNVSAPQDAKPGDFLNITIYAEGRQGSSSIWLNTSIAQPQYGVKVTAKTGSLEAEPGDKVTFVFNVKNTGDLADVYELGVTSTWDYELEKNMISIEPGENETVKVIVTVPDNATNGTTNTVILTAKSTNSDEESSASSTIKVIYTVPPEEEEKIGKIIGYILFVFLVAALLVIAIYLGKSAQKAVVLSCDEKIAEIPPGKKAEFIIKVANPLDKGKKMKYRMRVEGKLPENWEAKIDREEMVLDGGEEGEVKINVKVPPDASIEDWASLDVVASPEKGKSEKMDLLVTLREPKEILKTEIEHEPEEFKEGEKIITRVKIENVGEKDAENKKVILLVNGKEKNRVEGVNIPVDKIVEIEIPWVAEKENEVEVKIE